MKRREESEKLKIGRFPDVFLDNYPENSRFAESYRSLRTNIQFSFIEKAFQSILITSSGAGEGKSVSTANLSYTMAQEGKTVLVIDADLRKPVLSRIFQNQDSSGLSGLLSELFSTDVKSGSLGKFSLSDLIQLLKFQKKTGILNLADGQEKIDVFFLNGKMMNITWITRPEEKKLCATLVKNGLITAEQAEQAISRVAHTGQKVGYILINMGIVSEDDLSGFIKLHMLEGIRIGLQFKSGTFSFEKLSKSYFEHRIFNPVDLHQLYRQVVIGKEEFIYLEKEIHSSIVTTQVDHLFFLPSGPTPPRPAELLGSDRMSFLLSYLKRRFDILVIDSPPILLTSDAVLVAPQTDGVVLIVKSGLMKRELVKKSVEQLQRAKANLIGVALNQVDAKKEGYYKYYFKYYEDNRK